MDFITVEKILEGGKNPQTDEYEIPDDLALGKDKIIEQLKVLEIKLKEQEEQKPSTKIRKFDNDSEKVKKEIKQPVNTEPSTSFSKGGSLSSQSNLQKKQDMKDSLQSFFKERADVSIANNFARISALTFIFTDFQDKRP